MWHPAARCRRSARVPRGTSGASCTSRECRASARIGPFRTGSCGARHGETGLHGHERSCRVRSGGLRPAVAGWWRVVGERKTDERARPWKVRCLCGGGGGREEEAGLGRRRAWGGGGRRGRGGRGGEAGVGEKRGGDEAGWGRAGAEGGGMRAPTTRRSVGSRDAVDDRPHQGNARTCGVGPMGASPDGDGTGCAGSRGGLGEPRGRGHEGRDDAVADGPNTPRNRRSVSRETVKGAHAGRRSPGGRSGLLQEPSRVGEEVLRGQLTRRFM